MAENAKKGTSKAKATTKSTTSTKPRKKASATNGAPTVTTGSAAKTNGSAGKVTQVKITRQQVAELAHRFWNERGRQHGHHEEDWYRAEQELHVHTS